MEQHLPVASPRVIALIDMDCFYVAVHYKLHPEYVGKPAVVGQYKGKIQNSGIIAVSYEARAQGVKRGGMKMSEALKLCPELKIFQVEERYGKANLRNYRKGSDLVHEKFMKFTNHIERASVDESYIDLTELSKARLEMIKNCPEHLKEARNQEIKQISEQSFLTKNNEAYQDFYHANFEKLSNADQLLCMGNEIVFYMRKLVQSGPGFSLSAGIGPNKTYAKLVCSKNKPKKQTLLLNSHMKSYLETVKINSVRSLGGKFGVKIVQTLPNVELISDLNGYPEIFLQKLFGEKPGKSLFQLSHGFCDEIVKIRHFKDSLGSGRNFLGKENLAEASDVEIWVNNLLKELIERADEYRVKHKVVSKSLTVYACYRGMKGVSRVLNEGYDSVERGYDLEYLVRKVVSHLKTSEYFDKERMRFSPAIEHMMFTFSKLVKVRVVKKTVFDMLKKSENSVKDEDFDTSVLLNPKFTLNSVLKIKNQKRKTMELEKATVDLTSDEDISQNKSPKSTRTRHSSGKNDRPVIDPQIPKITSFFKNPVTPKFQLIQVQSTSNLEDISIVEIPPTLPPALPPALPSN